jgi:hypothetical protein
VLKKERKTRALGAVMKLYAIVMEERHQRLLSIVAFSSKPESPHPGMDGAESRLQPVRCPNRAIVSTFRILQPLFFPRRTA